MHSFASGKKRNFYGKADVIAYRLNRDGRTEAGGLPVFGASVTLLIGHGRQGSEARRRFANIYLQTAAQTRAAIV